MQIETVLAYALTAFGFLLTLLIGLVVYVFTSLRADVKGVAFEVGELNRNRAKLIHREDCRATTNRLHERLDEHDENLQTLGERMTRVEARMEIKP